MKNKIIAIEIGEYTINPEQICWSWQYIGDNNKWWLAIGIKPEQTIHLQFNTPEERKKAYNLIWEHADEIHKI